MEVLAGYLAWRYVAESVFEEVTGEADFPDQEADAAGAEFFGEG